MPFINLIEEQRIAQRRAASKAHVALMVLGGAAGFALIGCGFLFVANEAVEGEIGRLKTEAAKVQPLQDEIKGIEDQIALMGPKLTTLENAQVLTTKWDSVLNHLTTQTPKDIYLTNIRSTASDPAKPIEVNFAGMATQLQGVGEFILRLQGCADLEAVGLKFTQEKLVASSTGIEFEVGSTVAGSIEEEKTKKEGSEEEAK